MIPRAAVRVARPVAEWFEDWLSARFRSSGGKLILGPWEGSTTFPRLRYLDYGRLGAANDPLWLQEAMLTSRTLRPLSRLPLFSAPLLSIPSATVYVPGTLDFEWINSEATPWVLPRVTWQQIRPGNRWAEEIAQYTGVRPAAALTMRPQDPMRPEGNRRRKDQKVPGWYNAALAFINRTYGPLSEFLEIQHAFQLNRGDPGAQIAAIALGQAMDYQIGLEKRWVKQNVYDAGYWPFPVGYDTLSRLWR